MSITIGYPGGLEKAKIDYQSKVDQAAGQARLKYVTSIPSQDATYWVKLTDAQRFIADGAPVDNLADYPWLAGEVATYDRTPTEAAQDIVAKANEWAVVGVPIERIRLKAKQAIRDSDNVRSIHNIAMLAIQQLSEI